MGKITIAHFFLNALLSVRVHVVSRLPGMDRQRRRSYRTPLAYNGSQLISTDDLQLVQLYLSSHFCAVSCGSFSRFFWVHAASYAGIQVLAGTIYTRLLWLRWSGGN